MKKVLIVLTVIFLTEITTEAYEVRHNVAGPTHIVSHGYQRRSINNFGANAPFASGYRNGQRHREISRRALNPQKERLYTSGAPLSHSQPIQPPMSRFNKDFHISSGKSHTLYGVTYFD